MVLKTGSGAPAGSSDFMCSLAAEPGSTRTWSGAGESANGGFVDSLTGFFVAMARAMLTQPRPPGSRARGAESLKASASHGADSARSAVRVYSAQCD